MVHLCGGNVVNYSKAHRRRSSLRAHLGPDRSALIATRPPRITAAAAAAARAGYVGGREGARDIRHLRS